MNYTFFHVLTLVVLLTIGMIIAKLSGVMPDLSWFTVFTPMGIGGAALVWCLCRGEPWS